METIREKTKGMRFLGQRFVPDSYIFSQLVFPYTGELTGDPCFTSFEKQRTFPRGLDLMSLLGSKRAKAILKAQGDTAYKEYEKQWKQMADFLAELSPSDWHRNLYWGWLYCLKALFQEYGDGYQTFMKTGAWQDKQLNAALASWTELRHDTILCAKQSYTTAWGSPPPVVGYVEPVPEFYIRLQALSRMMREGLKAMEVLDTEAENRLLSLESILERLLQISIKQLENEPLTNEDYYFINDFGEELEETVQGISSKGISTVLIADVHTDQNSKKVLEEAVGYAEIMIVAYEVPDGRILMGAGPVFSYYEFKQPMSNRLTDAQWSEKLWLYDNFFEHTYFHEVSYDFDRPSWTYSYALGWELIEYEHPPYPGSGLESIKYYKWELIDKTDQAPDLTNIDLSEFNPVEPEDNNSQSSHSSKENARPFSYSTIMLNPFLYSISMPVIAYPSTYSTYSAYSSGLLPIISSQALSIPNTAQRIGQQFMMPDLIWTGNIPKISSYTTYLSSPWPYSLFTRTLTTPFSSEGVSYQENWVFNRINLPYFSKTYQYLPISYPNWH